MERSRTYFTSDVHLGLKVNDPVERERRFVDFLRSIRNPQTRALYLLGDIWDFWYEYRDVVPREGIRVVSELIQLMSEGVEVYFFPGNHDIWCYSFFESLGIVKLQQPHFTSIGGKRFCLGHGDGLGRTKLSYSLMLKIFHCRFLQRLFSTLHPWIAYRFAIGWSNGNRRTHEPYVFKGEKEPLYEFAVSSPERPDFFVFGHYHVAADCELPDHSRLVVLKDWVDGGTPHAVFDEQTSTFSLHC